MIKFQLSLKSKVQVEIEAKIVFMISRYRFQT